MQKICTLERNNKSIEVFLLDMEEVVRLKRKPYEIAFCYKDKVLITEHFINLSKDTRSIIMEHEVAHAIGIDDEIQADRRAILCYSIDKFKLAVVETYHYMNKFIKHDAEKINELIEKRIRLALS